VGVTFPGLV